MTEPRSTPQRTVPIRIAAADTGCSGAESFALMVLGDSMLPEFENGDVVIVEPDGHATEGSFVLALSAGEWVLRRLCRSGAGWRLQALNPAYPGVDLPDLTAVRGVIIQKSRPGRRRASKRYVG
jgi:SOS-response transcriptional repressor LexA